MGTAGGVREATDEFGWHTVHNIVHIHAMVARPIELEKEYKLRVQVRDSLINASLDGETVIAWRSPLARRDGNFQVTTFDALVVLHEVTIAPLKADAVLREPGVRVADPETPAQAASAVAAARLELHVAESALHVAEAEVQSVERRAAAMQATWKRTDNRDAKDTTELVEAEREAARAAARAERKIAAAQARLALSEAELRLHRAAVDQQDAAAKEVAAARELLDKGLEQVDVPSEQYTEVVPIPRTGQSLNLGG